VWYDVNADPDRIVDFLESKLKLRSLIDALVTFHDIDKCVEYMIDSKQNNIYCILVESSPRFDREILLSQLSTLSQVKSIYILTNKISESKFIPASSPLTFNDEDTMFQRLNGDILLDHNHLSSFDILQSSIVSSQGVICFSVSSENDDITKKNKQDASFMYFDLVCCIFIKMRTEGNEEPDYGKQDMVNYCRSKYENDTEALKIILEFEQTYEPSDAIRWYTRDCFVYRTVGEALRARDTIVLYKMRFFIVDLHLQLHDLYSKESNIRTSSCVLYRAQRIKKTEFELLKSNAGGGLMSFGYPLSTTEDRTVAGFYITPAKEARADGEESIFFEIEITDSKKSRTPFANIGYLSYFPDEEETLISIGAVFRVCSIKEQLDGLWVASLTLTEESDKCLTRLREYITEEIGGASNLVHLGKLMSQMLKYDDAVYFYEIVLKKASFNENLGLRAFIFDDLGTIARMRGDIKGAMELYTNAGRIAQNCSPVNNNQLTNTYANLGHLCLQIGGPQSLKMAFDYFKKGSKMVMDIFSDNPQKIAQYCSNLALLWMKRRDYVQALEQYKNAIQVLMYSIRTAHPSIALILNNIGSIYVLQENYIDALRCFEQALQIQQASLLPNHPAFIDTYRNLARLSLQQGKSEEAINCISKALDIAILQKDYDDFQMKQLQTDYALIVRKVEESVKQ
jgi:tetratricopeptide (TPR) repeat protein